MAYRRVTYEDRCQIFAFSQTNFSKAEISRRLGFSRSTIGREIRRNATNQGYRPMVAQGLARRRFKNCKRAYLVDEQMRDQIVCLLKQKWSPQQISGRLEREGHRAPSVDTIYRFILRHWKELGPYLRRYGRRGGGRYIQRKAKRGRFRSISKRPGVVDQRCRFGDWERDGMFVYKRKLILILNERKSRFVKLTKMGTGRPKLVTSLTNSVLTKIAQPVHTITNDNGPEFRDSPNQSWPVYHCDIGKPQQRGTVENTIGLLRQFLPRDTLYENLTSKTLRKIENAMNLRPRKCLGYKTPYEVLYKTTVALALRI